MIVVAIAAGGVYLFLLPAVEHRLPWLDTATPGMTPESEVSTADRLQQHRRELARQVIDEQITELEAAAETPVAADTLDEFVSPEQRITIPEPAAPAADAPADSGNLERATIPSPSRQSDRSRRVTIPELLEAAGVPPPEDSLFYAHSVEPDDDRGIWGIVHDGIVVTLADGIRLTGDDHDIEHYQIEIPPGEDQRREDGSSSYLGRVIHEKTRATYVYNYHLGTMGRNPDVIQPGQELVVVGFTREELVDIHDHFARR